MENYDELVKEFYNFEQKLIEKHSGTYASVYISNYAANLIFDGTKLILNRTPIFQSKTKIINIDCDELYVIIDNSKLLVEKLEEQVQKNIDRLNKVGSYKDKVQKLFELL